MGKSLNILHFLNDGIRTTFVAILPFIALDMSLNLKDVGFLGSTQAAVAIILAIPAGFIAARFGGFKSLVTFMLIYSAGAFLAGIAPNFFVLTLAYVMSAVGFGIFHTISFALVAKNSKHHNVGKNMGDFASIGDIGRVAMPPAAIFLISIFGWRPTLFLVGAIGLVTFLAIKITTHVKDTKNIEKEIEERENYKDFTKSTLLLFKLKHVRRIMLTAILDSFASSSIFIFLPFILLSKNIPQTQLAIIVGVYFAGSLFGRVVLGRLVDKIGGKKVFVSSEFLMALFLVALTQTGNYLVISVLCFAIGAFTRGTNPIVQSMISKLTSPNLYHKLYAVSEICTYGASVISTMAMGYVSFYYGVNTVYYISAAIAILATAPIITFAFLRRGTVLQP